MTRVKGKRMSKAESQRLYRERKRLGVRFKPKHQTPAQRMAEMRLRRKKEAEESLSESRLKQYFSKHFCNQLDDVCQGKKHTSASCKKQSLLNSVRITNIKTEKENKQESEEEELKPLAYVTVPAFDTEGDEEDDKNNVALQLKKYTEGNYSVPDLQDLSMMFESVIKKEEVDEFD